MAAIITDPFKKHMLQSIFDQAQIDSDGQPLETWTLWNAFVKDFQLGQLSYGDDDLTTATVELMYDWARVETANPSVAVAGGGTEFFNT